MAKYTQTGVLTTNYGLYSTNAGKHKPVVIGTVATHNTDLLYLPLR